jgi:hypothetical protein
MRIPKQTIELDCAPSVARRRVEIIVELADLLHRCGHLEAAKLLQQKAKDELEEVGL